MNCYKITHFRCLSGTSSIIYKLQSAVKLLHIRLITTTNKSSNKKQTKHVYFFHLFILFIFKCANILILILKSYKTCYLNA